MNKQNGFNRVELLITIAILGILVAVIIPSVANIARLADESQNSTANSYSAMMNIVNSIPKPETRYSAVSGQRLVIGKPKAIKDGFNTSTGEQVYQFCMTYYESNWFRRSFPLRNYDRIVFYLVRPNSDNKTVENNWGFNGQFDFTPSEIEQYQNYLQWTR